MFLEIFWNFLFPALEWRIEYINKFPNVSSFNFQQGIQPSTFICETHVEHNFQSWQALSTKEDSPRQLQRRQCKTRLRAPRRRYWSPCKLWRSNRRKTLVANSRQHQTQEVTMGPAAMGFHKTNMGWAHRRLPRYAGLQLYRESRQIINDWIRKCHPHVRVKKSKTYCFLTGLMLRCNVCVCLTKLGRSAKLLQTTPQTVRQQRTKWSSFCKSGTRRRLLQTALVIHISWCCYGIELFICESSLEEIAFSAKRLMYGVLFWFFVCV